MNTLHMIADWLDELDIPPEKANCVWLVGFPEVTFDRKNLTDSEYIHLIIRGNSSFKQPDHNPENLYGYHPLPVNSLMVRINNCLVRKRTSPHRVLYIDPTGIWENPLRESDFWNQTMGRED